MDEVTRGTKIGVAALRAGVDRKTARKYLAVGKLPSELAKLRTWRTRQDPFEEDWPQVEAMLEDAPEFEAKTLFEWLMQEQPDRYETGQLRTLQRRIRRWRAQAGPPKEVFFAQLHRPGERAQTDFTWATELEVTIAGELFEHMLCHVVLPYSNWEWATICRSESLAALRRGVQDAFFELGRVPQEHQTDNSTAATHDLRTGKRGFNEEYLALMRHLSMHPVTTGVGEKEQNGDVEALNGALKRRLKQHLLIRGSRDFESVEAYEAWLVGVLKQGNELRSKRLLEELAVMRPLNVIRLPEFSEVEVRVTTWSTIRVKVNTYSVPSRLIGERVRIRIYDDRLEVYYAGQRELVTERLRGRNGHHVDYRHIIDSLVRKPGAFARYRYREDLFPSLVFRRTYDALRAKRSERGADLEYLRILHLAARSLESAVAVTLEAFLEEGVVPDVDAVQAIVAPVQPEVPVLELAGVDLSEYDALLGVTQ